MNIQTRKNLILQMLAETPAVSVALLSDKLRLSKVSVRRLLTALEEEGLLKRTWGGAVRSESTLREFCHGEKETRNLAEKESIALAAYHQIVDGEAIFLDSGTTTLALARLLVKGNKRQVMVVTNALNIVLAFSHAQDIDVMVIGGQFRHRILCCTGFFAMEALKYLHFDKGFITGNHFSQHRGFTTSSLQEAEMKRQVIAISKESYVLMDSSKYGGDSLSLIVPCEGADFLITDWHLPAPVAQDFLDKGLQVMVAQKP